MGWHVPVLANGSTVANILLPTSRRRGQPAASVPSGLSQGVFGDQGVYGHGVASLGLFSSSREL